MNTHVFRKLPVRTRILMLLVTLALAFIGIACGLLLLDRHQALVLSRHTQSERAVFYDRLLTLRANSLRTMVYDNSYWDEIVTFVHTGSKLWAKQNIDTTLTTYDLDGCWVFRPNMTSLYGAVSHDARHLQHLSLSAAAAQSLLHHGAYDHFFLHTRDGLLELRSASIHDSDDVAHTGPAKGYLLAGRLWDKEYLGELAGLTGSRAEMLGALPTLDTLPKSVSGGSPQMRFYQSCLGWDGKPVACLLLVSDDPTLSLLQMSAVRVMVLLGVFSLLLVALVSACLLHWVSIPLWILSRAMTAEKPEALTPLKTDRAEFGTLARLISDFFSQREELQAARNELEQRVAARTEELAEANQQLQAAYDATIAGWSRALDLRDNETEGHSHRVTDITLRLARTLGVPEEDLVHIRRGALLHDIGKMGIPDRILLKNGPLNADEMDAMRQHPLYAFEMLYPIEFLQPALDIPYSHHEQWNGSGYPRGLQQDAIPLSARIFAVADVWDALRSDRPYRKAWSEEEVCAHIQSLSGSHFDPDIVDVFLSMMQINSALQRAA